MKIPDFFTSPPPATGWSLDTGVAAVVRRHGKTEVRCAAVDIPAGTFDIGPVGLQAVDEDKLRPVLTRLNEEVEGSNRAAVVVPTGWLRTHLLEFEELPRRQADIHDMVMWRLKKLLPVAPSSLRLATVAQPPTEGNRRLLILVGVERAMAALEAVFESVKVSPGLITPRLFAVNGGSDVASPMLAIQQESKFLSIMLLLDDTPHVVRTKPLAGGDWAVVERELILTMAFIESRFGVTNGMTVKVSAEDAHLAERLKSWIAAEPRLTAATAPAPSLVFDGTTIRDRVGAHRLDPVANVVSGGVR
jgi:hypothetical protein